MPKVKKKSSKSRKSGKNRDKKKQPPAGSSSPATKEEQLPDRSSPATKKIENLQEIINESEDEEFVNFFRPVSFSPVLNQITPILNLENLPEVDNEKKREREEVNYEVNTKGDYSGSGEYLPEGQRKYLKYETRKDNLRVNLNRIEERDNNPLRNPFQESREEKYQSGNLEQYETNVGGPDIKKKKSSQGDRVNL